MSFARSAFCFRKLYEGITALLNGLTSGLQFIIHAEHPNFIIKVILIRAEDYFWDSKLP